jgi:hypothetical protein
MRRRSIGSHPERFGDALGLFFAAFVDASAGEFDLGTKAARAKLIEGIVLDSHHRFDVTRIVQWRYCGDLLAVGHFGFPLRVSIRWEECTRPVDVCQLTFVRSFRTISVHGSDCYGNS